MPENNDSVKIAEAGKKKAKSLSKEQIKGMSKYKAQQILNEKDPDLVKKIEFEVAERAKQLKKKIMIAGFVVAVAVVVAIIYNQMKKNETVSPSDKYSLVLANKTIA
ncbi:MAG: hypothetical protein NE330_19845 [Lentisphaeraceae bacterium]|nr:hypothetical protein [Lentisphaeraceae bacterium]